MFAAFYYVVLCGFYRSKAERATLNTSRMYNHRETPLLARLPLNRCLVIHKFIFRSRIINSIFFNTLESFLENSAILKNQALKIYLLWITYE